MKSWWIRVPIILVCVLTVGFTLFFGTITRTASGNAEFVDALLLALNGFGKFLEFVLEVIQLVI